MISIESLVAAEQRLAQLKHQVITRWIKVEDICGGVAAERKEMLTTLYTIDPPVVGRVPLQDSWYLSRIQTKQDVSGVFCRYRVKFRHKGDATLFKLAWA